MAFIGLKSPFSLFRLLRYGFSSSIKWFLLPNLSFHLFYYVFVINLLCHVVVCWFFVVDSEGNTTSIIQRSHIKSLFVNMLHLTWNLRYSRHIRIISCVGFESFLLAINLNIVSSSYVFSSLISMFRCKGITVLNQ